ncbi:hypothetical protein CDL60_03265 [Roseateles noduli]|nr:hypothetical protein CDL60_03265 [Roseateles noduli]
MMLNSGFGTLASLLSGVGISVCLVCLGLHPRLSFAELTALREQEAKVWRVEAREAVFGVVPEGLRACGFVALDGDRTAALKCVEHAERHQLPYWVASEADGIDSAVWVVVLKDADGAWQLLLDSYGLENAPRPRFGVAKLPCESIEAHAAVNDPDGHATRSPAFDCYRR